MTLLFSRNHRFGHEKIAATTFSFLLMHNSRATGCLAILSRVRNVYLVEDKFRWDHHLLLLLFIFLMSNSHALIVTCLVHI